jgi:hypothetical protein
MCVIWVDDFIFATFKEQNWDSLLAQLKHHFNITGGPLKQFLGLEIARDRDRRKMSITQTTVAKSLLHRFGMADSNPVPTPCPAGAVFSKKDCPQEIEKQALEERGRGATEFRKRSALINFLSCWTRPDVTFTVNKLSKFMSNPGAVHWAGLLFLIKYIKGSADVGLCYDFSEQVKGLHGFTDASYADCPDTSRSTLGYAFFYGPAPISWYSKLHSFVTTSTNHSEYAALALGAKEAKWLAELFQEIDPSSNHLPVPIYGDSSGVIALVFNPVDHQANKHIRVADHYARELSKEGIITPYVLQVKTTEQTCSPSHCKAAFKKAVAFFVASKVAAQAESICMFHDYSVDPRLLNHLRSHPNSHVHPVQADHGSNADLG